MSRLQCKVGRTLWGILGGKAMLVNSRLSLPALGLLFVQGRFQHPQILVPDDLTEVALRLESRRLGVGSPQPFDLGPQPRQTFSNVLEPPTTNSRLRSGLTPWLPRSATSSSTPG